MYISNISTCHPTQITWQFFFMLHTYMKQVKTLIMHDTFPSIDDSSPEFIWIVIYMTSHELHAKHVMWGGSPGALPWRTSWCWLLKIRFSIQKHQHGTSDARHVPCGLALSCKIRKRENWQDPKQAKVLVWKMHVE